jgi:hypothetical protein
MELRTFQMLCILLSYLPLAELIPSLWKTSPSLSTALISLSMKSSEATGMHPRAKRWAAHLVKGDHLQRMPLHQHHHHLFQSLVNNLYPMIAHSVLWLIL